MYISSVNFKYSLLRSRSCPCQYITHLVLSFVAILSCLVSLFQSHVAGRNSTLTGPVVRVDCIH